MKRLFIIPLLLFWCGLSHAAENDRNPRFTQPGEYYQWEWRFNKGAQDVCFGQTTCPANWGVYTGYLDVMRFQCVTGGQANKIRILSPAGGTNTGTIRMGIYSDVGGVANTLLWEGTDQSYVADSWIEEAVSGVTLVAGTYYWMGFKVSQTDAELCYAGGGPLNSHRWLSGQLYVNPFPNPFVAGPGVNTNRYTMQLCVPGGVEEPGQVIFITVGR